MAELEAKFRKMGQSYESVIAAAREARRINAVRIHGGEGGDDEKVTTEAMRRVLDGEVLWEIVEPRAAADGTEGGAQEAAEPVEGSSFED